MKFLPCLLISVSGAIALGVSLSDASQPPAWNQPLLMARYSPPRPPSNGAPGTNRGAASRGCLMLAKITKDAVLDNLGALAPAYQEKATTHVWARTTAERPKIWFYNPYKPDSIESIEFVLQDDQDNDIYRVPVSLPPTAGMIGVQVSKTASLQPGKLYHWSLSVKGKDSACTSTSASPAKPSPRSNAQFADSMTAMVYVDGWIERAPLSSTLSDRLKQSTPQQQAILYGENGFWYDAITALAEAQLAAPNDTAIKTDWNALLQDGSLEKLSAQPLINCCNIQ
ncbi:DUF928 domain-containing protein [Phormidium sp. CLA17]|uniref:DUF928 domain-containing protein n=1 Tax=Leptolyngbya sp. Cla-17 TaxID=2803751 RepID=UPI0014918B74|nr:DUF928 domain-containing protein [Leptolyngbya sp. Cla-17]MBM0740588.1 DUF928 domain-containing protein [Leptolyngbya sp. Cla-17]